MPSKKKLVLLFFISLASAVIAAGCQKDKTDNKEDTAYGRYVEANLKFPVELGYIYGINQIKPGSFALLGIDKAEHNIHCLTSDDSGKTWSEKRIPFFEEIKNSKKEFSLEAIQWDKNGGMYLLFDTGDDTAGEAKQVFAYINEKGEFSKMPFSVPDSSSDSSGVTQMDLVEDGSFLFSTYYTVMHVDGTSGKLLAEYSLPTENENNEINSMAVYQNTLAVSGYKSIVIYDLKTKKMTNQFSVESNDNNNILSQANNYVLLSFDEEGGLYYASDFGIYHSINKTTMFEKIVDGSLTSLSIPSIKRAGFMTGQNSFYILGYSDTYSLYSYDYDPDMPTLPSEELVIYSLEDNPTIRQAIGTFTSKNPQIGIRFEIGFKEEGMSRDDVLKKLMANIMADNGPDLFIMDGLSIESYTKKSILLDLSDFLEQKRGENAFFQNITDSFKQEDGKTYAIPARFSVPVMLMDKKDSQTINELADLAAWAQKNKDAYDAPLNTHVPEVLIRQLYPVCSFSFFTEDGKVDEGYLSKFLEQIDILSSLDDKNELAEGEAASTQIEFESLPWSEKKTGACIGNLNNFEAVYAPYTTMLKRKEGVLTPLFHKNIFIPSSIIAVNAQSKKKESALSFLETILSDEVLAYDYNDGLPVSVKALQQNKDKRNGTGHFSTYGFHGIMLEIKYPTKEFSDEIYKMIQSLNQIGKQDFFILSTLLEETKNYFKGSDTLEHTVKIISDKVNTYQSEQS